MSSMRIIRLDIPDKYKPEFFEENIIKIHNSISQTGNSRIRINIYRSSHGKYKPEKNTPSFIISCESINNSNYELNKGHYEVDLFKDYYLDNQLISSIKSNNKIINVVASIYAKENGFDNCILLNKDKLVTELINSNLFIIKEGKIYTPPLKSGCLNGVLRKNLFKILSSSSFELYEQDLSTFDISQSDEIFGTNIAQGIFSVTKFRKKEYDCIQTKKIITILNDSVSLD
tara:strand:- start:421 stop:1110 length:690 start_codon:yes stop_codon:yes gene_type:complete